MSVSSFMFYFFECTAAISAIALVLIRNVFYGALTLIVCLLAVAGIFVLAFAEFIAVTQILVYAGGILVVIIFGIMLTTKISGKPLAIEHGHVSSGVLIGCSFFILLSSFISAQLFPPANPSLPAYNDISVIGTGIITDYALPFEIAGILLLIALIGAAVTASHNAKKT